jgi:hypothetical protein
VQLASTLTAISNLFDEAIHDFETHRDVNKLCEQVRNSLLAIVEVFLAGIIEKTLRDPEFLRHVKIGAAKKALAFDGYRLTSIRLLTGNPVKLLSPYFAKAKTKCRPTSNPPKRLKETGCHFGLDVLGLLNRCTALFSSIVVQAALLCPSFALAKRTLQSNAIKIDVKTIHRLTMALAAKALPLRGRVSLDETDRVDGKTVLVCLDGGRLRERRTKKEPTPKGRKRPGYHTDWKEPLQFVIHLVEQDGTISRNKLPLNDATLHGIDSVFDLLEVYLTELEITNADRVVFCCDGARSYWKRIAPLAKKLKIPNHYEVIDYTHAKQNLYEVMDNLSLLTSPEKRKQIANNWLNLLWEGNLDDLRQEIINNIKNSKSRQKALDKFDSYFIGNRERMMYAEFRRLKIPVGSGCVESAIRRVINLRLKSPGIFWKPETAESMLFLRNQLLAGRWNIMLNNVLSQTRSLCCH